MKEIWKSVEEYEGLYEISNYGRIKSLHNYRGKNNILKPRLKKGYYQIGLRKKGVRKWYAVHRLTAKAFIPNPNNLPQVNHKDENKLNNKTNNLEWCTVSYNNCYGTRLKRVNEANKLKKKIIQYDLTGNKIKTFSSIASASRETNTNITGISKCINNRQKTSNNYIWVYESVVMPNA